MSTREDRAEYEVDLTACFVFSIRSTLEGPRRLSRAEIETLIEDNWLWVSLDTEVLLESHWQLESVKERMVPEGALDDEGAAVPERVDTELGEEPPHLET